MPRRLSSNGEPRRLSSSGGRKGAPRPEQEDLSTACLEAKSIKELRGIFRRSIQADRYICARANTLEGKLPLHFIALNKRLILQSNETARVEQFILEDLIPAHVGAITAEDDNHRIPFTEVITNWIRTRRTLRGWQTYTPTPADRLRMLAEKTKKRLRDKVKKQKEAERENRIRISFADSIYSEDDDDDSDEENDDEDDLPAIVEWSLKMLSTILDEVLTVSQLGSMPASQKRTNSYGSDDASAHSNDAGSTSASSSNSSLRNNFSEITSQVVEEVAAIPFLMQELLLIKDKEARARLFSLSLVHKVLFCEKSLGRGGWIIGMLKEGLKHSNKQSVIDKPMIKSIHGADEGYFHAEGAVFYLEAISELNIRDDLDVHIHGNTVSQADLRHFRKHQNQLFGTVGRLDGLVRLVVVQEEDLVNRAAVTPVIQRFLDRQIFSPFALAVSFFEGIQHVLLIACFRLGPSAATFHLSPLDTGFQSQQYLLSNMLLASCVAFFFLKETHRGIAKYALSKDLFWNDLFTFWNILDLLPIVLVPFCIIAVDNTLLNRALGESEDNSIPFHLRLLIALTTPLLWLRVLSHIKSQNRQLATFILCSVEIMKDIKWFMLVLFVAMSAFAQMLVSLTKEPHIVGGKHGSSFDGYLKAYTIMLGDFDSLSFQAHPIITALFIFYTFGVTIVLLNILIAIVSESYTKSMVSAKIMLSKARLMFVARLMSANYFHRLWRQGKTGKTRRNLNLAAFAFGAFISKLVVSTVQAKLSRLGKLTMYSTTWFDSRWGLNQLDIEGIILFILVSGYVFSMRMALILIQNETSDAAGNKKGTDGRRATAATNSWLNSALTYFVKELYLFVGTQIDRLGEIDENKSDNEAGESSLVGSEGRGGHDRDQLMKLSTSVATSRHELKKELKRTTDQVRDALGESERATQAERIELEEKLGQLKSQMEKNQDEVRSLIETSEERIVLAILSKMQQGIGDATKNQGSEERPRGKLQSMVKSMRS